MPKRESSEPTDEQREFEEKVEDMSSKLNLETFSIEQLEALLQQTEEQLKILEQGSEQMRRINPEMYNSIVNQNRALKQAYEIEIQKKREVEK